MISGKTSILMAGGGTGGHLWPGIALAKELQKMTEVEIVFFVPGKPVDISILSTTNFSRYKNSMRSLPRKLTQLPNFFSLFLRGCQETLRIFRQYKPDLVVGLGGYGALSAGLLASYRNTPLVMIESNKVAGKVVKILSKKSTNIYTQDEVAGISNQNVKLLGIPIRSDIAVNKKSISEDKKEITCLIMGGSQGASCINKALCESLPYISKEKVHFIHLTGKDTEFIQNQYTKNNIKAEVYSFYHNIAELYKKSDIIICRSGGSTIAEISAIGLPAILIPFAKAAENHQYKNACAMEKAKGALVIEEQKLTGKLIAETIQKLSNDKKTLQMMNVASKNYGKPNATKDIARDILDIISQVKGYNHE